VARELPKEAIEFLIEHEEFLIVFTVRLMKSMLASIPPEDVRAELMKQGMSPERADAHMSIAGAACTAARRIKAGEIRNAVLNQIGIPTTARAVFFKLVDAAIAESGDHNLRAFASRPAGVKLELWHWIPRSRYLLGAHAFGFLGVAFILILTSVLFSKVLILVALVLVLLFASIAHRTFINVRTVFMYGHLAPAKVVNMSPRMLATHTNLCSDSDIANEDECYVLKVERCRLTDTEFSKIGLGGFVACVCGYGPGSKSGRWSDVTAFTVQTATANASVILESLKKIPEADWVELDEAAAHLTPKQRQTPGIYRVPAPGSAPPRRKVADTPDDDLRLI